MSAYTPAELRPKRISTAPWRRARLAEHALCGARDPESRETESHWGCGRDIAEIEARATQLELAIKLAHIEAAEHGLLVDQLDWMRCLRGALKSMGFHATRSFSVTDHVVPLSEGGADDPSNWQLLCQWCHRQKTREEARRRARSPWRKKGFRRTA